MENIIPEGRCKAIVHDWSTGLSAAKSTPFVKLGLKILEGEYTGRVVDWYGWLTEKTVDRVSTDLAALGYDGEDPLVDFARAKHADQLPGKLRPVQIVIRHEEWRERVQVRVAYINEISEAKPVDAGTAASIRDAFRAAKAARGARRAPDPVPLDQDAPFLPSRPLGGLALPSPRGQRRANDGQEGHDHADQF
jgi:hypothetical protein